MKYFNVFRFTKFGNAEDKDGQYKLHPRKLGSVFEKMVGPVLPSDMGTSSKIEQVRELTNDIDDDLDALYTTTTSECIKACDELEKNKAFGELNKDETKLAENGSRGEEDDCDMENGLFQNELEHNVR